MQGKVFKKGKPARPKGVYVYRPITAREIIYEAFKQADALPYLPKLRKSESDLVKLLSAAHLSEKLAGNLTAKEQTALEADLSGLAAGVRSGTIPERLVAKWLEDNHMRYAGKGYSYAPQNGDWGFQVPLIGGRAGEGTVADIFISPAASHTRQGRVIAVDGVYWHLRAFNEQRDASIQTRLISKGYKVAHITDIEVLRGTLDQTMKQIMIGQRDART